ncbi:MAG: hypothetical protein JNJ70_12985 [Verrucomicrobiales bacterium]|nr:hypothetical protein [Verrucomicrobiales bacterium]
MPVSYTKKTKAPATLCEAIEQSLHAAARYNRGAEERPVAVLWTDADGQWLPVIAKLRGRLNARPFLATDLSRGNKGARLFRAKVNIHWKKDRGNEPAREKEDFPWFWIWDEKTQDFAGGAKFDGNRWNDLHYTTAFKQAARDRHRKEGGK